MIIQMDVEVNDTFCRAYKFKTFPFYDSKLIECSCEHLSPKIGDNICSLFHESLTEARMTIDGWVNVRVHKCKECKQKELN